MGDEYTNVINVLLDENAPVQSQGGGGVGMLPGGNAMPTSNQSGIPMSGPELNARNMANVGTF